jgi:hypothetical protein
LVKIKNGIIKIGSPKRISDTPLPIIPLPPHKKDELWAIAMNEMIKIDLSPNQTSVIPPTRIPLPPHKENEHWAMTTNGIIKIGSPKRISDTPAKH